MPQLWVDDRNGLAPPRVTHLCPFCGAIVHDSGGKLGKGAVAIIIGFICACALLFILLFTLGRR